MLYELLCNIVFAMAITKLLIKYWLIMVDVLSVAMRRMQQNRDCSICDAVEFAPLVYYFSNNKQEQRTFN